MQAITVYGGSGTEVQIVVRTEENNMLIDLFTIAVGTVTGYVLRKLGVEMMSVGGFATCCAIAAAYAFLMSFIK